VARFGKTSGWQGFRRRLLQGPPPENFLGETTTGRHKSVSPTRLAEFSPHWAAFPHLMRRAQPRPPEAQPAVALERLIATTWGRRAEVVAGRVQAIGWSAGGLRKALSG
jgi:hypothetical protein